MLFAIVVCRMDAALRAMFTSPKVSLSIPNIAPPSSPIRDLLDDELRMQGACRFHALQNGDHVARAGLDPVQRAHEIGDGRLPLERYGLGFNLTDFDPGMRHHGRAGARRVSAVARRVSAVARREPAIAGPVPAVDAR